MQMTKDNRGRKTLLQRAAWEARNQAAVLARDAKAAEYRKSLASRFRPARGASTGASRAPPPTSDADAADDSVDGARGAPGSTRERAATRGGAGLRAVASLKPAPFQRPIPTKVAAQVQRIFSGEGIDANNEDAEVDATAFMRDAAAFPGEWKMAAFNALTDPRGGERHVKLHKLLGLEEQPAHLPSKALSTCAALWQVLWHNECLFFTPEHVFIAITKGYFQCKCEKWIQTRSSTLNYHINSKPHKRWLRSKAELSAKLLQNHALAMGAQPMNLATVKGLVRASTVGALVALGTSLHTIEAMSVRTAHIADALAITGGIDASTAANDLGQAVESMGISAKRKLEELAPYAAVIVFDESTSDNEGTKMGCFVLDAVGMDNPYLMDFIPLLEESITADVLAGHLVSAAETMGVFDTVQYITLVTDGHFKNAAVYDVIKKYVAERDGQRPYITHKFCGAHALDNLADAFVNPPELNVAGKPGKTAGGKLVVSPSEMLGVITKHVRLVGQLLSYDPVAADAAGVLGIGRNFGRYSTTRFMAEVNTLVLLGSTVKGVPLTDLYGGVIRDGKVFVDESAYAQLLKLLSLMKKKKQEQKGDDSKVAELLDFFLKPNVYALVHAAASMLNDITITVKSVQASTSTTVPTGLQAGMKHVVDTLSSDDVVKLHVHAAKAALEERLTTVSMDSNTFKLHTPPSAMAEPQLLASSKWVTQAMVDFKKTIPRIVKEAGDYATAALHAATARARAGNHKANVERVLRNVVAREALLPATEPAPLPRDASPNQWVSLFGLSADDPANRCLPVIKREYEAYVTAWPTLPDWFKDDRTSKAWLRMAANYPNLSQIALSQSTPFSSSAGERAFAIMRAVESNAYNGRMRYTRLTQDVLLRFNKALVLENLSVALQVDGVGALRAAGAGPSAAGVSAVPAPPLSPRSRVAQSQSSTQYNSGSGTLLSAGSSKHSGGSAWPTFSGGSPAGGRVGNKRRRDEDEGGPLSTPFAVHLAGDGWR